jgi:hypothetical protein
MPDQSTEQRRQYLENARREAARARNDSERRSWLTIAASWERLLGLEPQPQQHQQQQKLGSNDNDHD